MPNIAQTELSRTRSQETGSNMNKRIRTWWVALVVTTSVIFGMTQTASVLQHAYAEEQDTAFEQVEGETATDPQVGETFDAATGAIIASDGAVQESITAADDSAAGSDDAMDAFAESPAVDPALTAADDAQEKASWTYAIYICASDLEADAGSASGNLDIILKADVPDNVNILVYTGGTYEWQEQDNPGYVRPDPTKSQIWRIANHKMTLLETYDYQDFASQATLESFLNYCIDKYPAEHMMVELWNHGGGPLKGAEFSYVAGATKSTDDGDYMPMNNIAAALSNCSANYGKKFDLICFDACLMNNAEVAYALKDSGEYLVASEEPLPGSGLNYYWLNAFNEDAFKALDGREADVYLATRIVDLCTQGPTGEAVADVDACKAEWANYGKALTLAVTDLSKMDAVKNAADDLGKELRAVYGSDGGSKEFTKLVRATARVRGMAEDELGLMDIYKLCRAIIGADVNNELNAAAQALIDATGTPDAQATSGKGHVGPLAKQGCMLYAGAAPSVGGGNGMSIFFPVSLGTDKAYLESATTDFEGKLPGTTTTCYRRLAFAQDAPDYETFMRDLANTVEPRKNYGSTVGIALDEAAGKVYMTTPEGADQDSITYVEANLTSNWSDGKEYYLGKRLATYNAELDRYETDTEQQWLCINGVPVTFFEIIQGNSRYLSVPCLIVEDGNDVSTGSTVDISKVAYLQVSKSWFDDEPYTFVYYREPGEDLNGRVDLFKTDSVSFRPLRRLVNEDGTYGDYVAGDLVTTHVRDFGSSGAFKEFLIPATNSAPSDAAVKLSGWSFMAYDKNRKAYASDPYYVVDLNVDKLEMMDIADQTYTGSAIEPKALFAIEDVTGLDAETLATALPGYTYRTSYANNVNVGTATVTVEVVSDKTGGVVRTLTKQFNIVAKSDPTPTPTPTPTPEQVTYSCKSGNGQSWTKGSTKALKFTFKRSVNDKTSLTHFTGILVDGAPVDSSNYQLNAGSVAIQLKSTYLENLSTGKHTITASFDDGKASASFTVKAKTTASSKKSATAATKKATSTKKTTTKSSLPKTGDPTVVLPSLAVVGGALVLLGARRRKNSAA